MKEICFRDWSERALPFGYGGRRVFYHDEGEGEVLLCIHGFPTSSWDWSRLWPGLTARFRCVAPDMIGFGQSDKPANYPYSIFDQADLLEELLRHLGVQSFHVLAHDYGDTVAQELLARYDDGLRGKHMAEFTIRSACLLNGGLFPDAQRPLLMQKLLLTPLGPLLARLTSRKMFFKSFGSLFGPKTRPTDEELDEFWRLVSLNRGTLAIPRLVRYMKERRRHHNRWAGILMDSPAPLRLIIGLADPVSGRLIADQYAETAPEPDVVELENIGHYPQVEDPGGVLKALWEFAPLAEEAK